MTDPFAKMLSEPFQFACFRSFRWLYFNSWKLCLIRCWAWLRFFYCLTFWNSSSSCYWGSFADSSGMTVSHFSSLDVDSQILTSFQPVSCSMFASCLSFAFCCSSHLQQYRCFFVGKKVELTVDVSQHSEFADQKSTAFGRQAFQKNEIESSRFQISSRRFLTQRLVGLEFSCSRVWWRLTGCKGASIQRCWGTLCWRSFFRKAYLLIASRVDSYHRFWCRWRRTLVALFLFLTLSFLFS